MREDILLITSFGNKKRPALVELVPFFNKCYNQNFWMGEESVSKRFLAPRSVLIVTIAFTGT